MRPIIHHVKTLHIGRVFNFVIENITFPGKTTVDLEIIRHPGASAVIAMDEDDRVAMLRQYRHAVGDYIWEIPAGTFEPGEIPEECAKRELLEEAGVEAEYWQKLGEITPVPGYSDERIYIFLARHLAMGNQKLDKDEVLEVMYIPLDNVFDMAHRGDIQDAKTLSALFFVT